MSLRKPPALATWLLQHIGSSYHRESLAGDLFEEYQNGRSRLWYWQQAAAAVGVGGIRRVGLLLAGVARSASLRLLTEAAALLGVVGLAQQSWQFCSIHALLVPTAFLTLAGTIALALSVGFYLSLTFGSLSMGRPQRGDAARSNSERRKQTPFKRRMAAFALTALSAGTLTWASTSSEARCTAQSCTCAGSGTSVAPAPSTEHAPL